MIKSRCNTYNITMEQLTEEEQHKVIIYERMINNSKDVYNTFRMKYVAMSNIGNADKAKASADKQKAILDNRITDYERYLKSLERKYSK